jgi:hypothetical protein
MFICVSKRTDGMSFDGLQSIVARTQWQEKLSRTVRLTREILKRKLNLNLA